MEKEKTLLAATDFSENSAVALMYAIEIAEAHGFRLAFYHNSDVHIPRSVPSNIYADLVESYRAEYVEKLLRHVERVCFESGKAFDSANFEFIVSVDDGETSYNLDRIVRERQMRGVVLGTRGLGGFKKFFLGSTAQNLIRIAEYPIIVVPSKCEFKQISKIVYASDLISLDEEMRRTVLFAKLFDAQVFVLHVQSEKDELLINGLSLVAEQKQKNDYDKIEFSLLPQGDNDLSDRIHDFAKTIEADMIIMFTEHLNFWKRLYTESITEEMLSLSNIPLIAVKGK